VRAAPPRACPPPLTRAPRSLQYFFAHLERVFTPGYMPTNEDIVHTRARTVGITETAFQLRDHEMVMVDVGGQKSERRKWIHCFQDVTSILFLVSLSGYDQCLVEDKDANQMQDAMTIWDSICHSQWFKATSIVRRLRPCCPPAVLTRARRSCF
jgi:guanine nucleotide-binding protein subunit alpha